MKILDYPRQPNFFESIQIIFQTFFIFYCLVIFSCIGIVSIAGIVGIGRGETSKAKAIPGDKSGFQIGS